MFSRSSRIRHAISRTATIAIVVVIVVIIAAAGAYALLPKGSTSTSSSSSSSISTSNTVISSSSSGSSSSSSTNASFSSTSSTNSTSTSVNGSVPSSFTYEQTQTYNYLDPGVTYYTFDGVIEQQVYEPLVQFSHNTTTVIPWLAANYTVSHDLKTINWSLRQNIKFADGEPFNATSAWFSFNRLLISDGATPVGIGTQAAWIIQQLLNTNLSTYLGGTPTLNAAYANTVLAENFIQVTGPYTFTMHIMNPNAAIFSFLAGSSNWAYMLAPSYVMQHDIAVWNQSSNGYTLTYPKLSGNLTSQAIQYFRDYMDTCTHGITPNGCGRTYLDDSIQGSLAGTGPYTLQSVDTQAQVETFKANPNYWGGGYSTPFHAQIPTVVVKYVPDSSTRLIDLQNAARSGQAMAVDVTADQLYSVADRNSWLNNHKLVSTIPGVTLYGPYPNLNTLFDPFDTNVSNPSGGYYSFQPFADQRIRLAFADAVNISAIDQSVNNNLGQVAPNVVAPGLNPQGVYNASNGPIYSYNLTGAQNLLLAAMENPLTHFTLYNGSVAPAGVFNNTFGCSAADLSANGGTCKSPVHPDPSTINLYVGSADPVDIAMLDQMAGNINNITGTYNMGFTVSVVPEPTGQLLTQSFSVPSHLYFYALGWFADYPWVTDFTSAVYPPGSTYAHPDGWNLSIMQTLSNRATVDTTTNNTADLISAVNQMNSVANHEVMYLWTFNDLNFQPITSNVHGFVYNPAEVSGSGGVALEEFYTLY